MDRHGVARAGLAQEHIDDWIAEATSQRRYLIRYFLKWTTSRRLTRELTVPRNRAATASRFAAPATRRSPPSLLMPRT